MSYATSFTAHVSTPLDTTSNPAHVRLVIQLTRLLPCLTIALRGTHTAAEGCSRLHVFRAGSHRADRRFEVFHP